MDGEHGKVSVVYQTRPEKTLKKFKENDDIDCWIDIATGFTRRMTTETDKIDLILNFLDKRPLTEIRFRIDRSNATADQVFGILRSIYSPKESLSTLRQKFYSRRQETGESLNEYSYALMEILMIIEQKQNVKHNMDGELKDRFADGVHDVVLCRELKRLNKERPDLKFFELRDEANEWVSCAPVAENATSEVVAANDGMQTVLKLLKEQQAEITKLSNAVYNGPPHATAESSGYYRGRGQIRGRGGSHSWNHGRDSEWNSNRGKSSSQHREASVSNTQVSRAPITCYYCHQPNHVEMHCIKKKQDNITTQKNFSHSN